MERNLINDFQREVEIAQREYNMGGFIEVSIALFNGSASFEVTLWKHNDRNKNADSLKPIIAMGSGKSIREAINNLIQDYNEGA